jgi:hypothetical protein
MRLKFSLDLGRFGLYFSTGTAEPEQEPQPQGSTSGDLSLAPAWDHNEREPVARLGFHADGGKP